MNAQKCMYESQDWFGRDQYSLCVMDVFLKSCMYTNQILFQALQESLFKGTYGKSFRRELAIT